GGIVYAESNGEGKGATFTVRLPHPKVEAKPSTLRRTLLEARETTTSDRRLELDGLQVLIVGDEPDTIDLLTIMIKQYGAEVKAATSAREALETLEKWHPDVLVTDIGMPGEDGYELIRKVRAQESDRNKKVPAVALTAYTRAEDRVRALSSGFQLHVP